MTHSPRDAARSERRESMEAMRVQDMQARAKNAAGCKARGDALTRYEVRLGQVQFMWAHRFKLYSDRIRII